MTDPRFGASGHASQEGGLVGQVLDTERLESTDSHVSAKGTRSSSSSSVLAQHLGVDSRQSKGGDIGYDDEGSGEDTFVSCFGALDDLGAENHVEAGGRRGNGEQALAIQLGRGGCNDHSRPRHATCGNLV